MNMIYRYECLLRPPGPGAIPRDGCVCVDQREYITSDMKHVWGYVYYDHKIPDKLASDYDLRYACEMPTCSSCMHFVGGGDLLTSCRVNYRSCVEDSPACKKYEAG